MSTATTASPLDLLEQMAASAARQGQEGGAERRRVAGLVARWQAAKADVDTANSLLETIEALIAEAAPSNAEACRASGCLEASVKVNGKLLFAQTSRYGKLPATRLA